MDCVAVIGIASVSRIQTSVHVGNLGSLLGHYRGTISILAEYSRSAMFEWKC
jgi:hypothetical protein